MASTKYLPMEISSNSTMSFTTTLRRSLNLFWRVRVLIVSLVSGSLFTIGFSSVNMTIGSLPLGSYFFLLCLLLWMKHKPWFLVLDGPGQKFWMHFGCFYKIVWSDQPCCNEYNTETWFHIFGPQRMYTLVFQPRHCVARD